MDKVQQAFALQQSAQTSPAQLQEANKWLEHFQGTTEAWQVVDQLLRQPAENGTASAAHVFAAQTMRTKIQYDWAELPAQSHESLRSSLLEHVIRFGQVGPGSSAAPQLRSPSAALVPREGDADAWPCEHGASRRCAPHSLRPVLHSQGPQPVLTQLCLAIATLALHMDSWQTVVPDLIRALTTPPEEATSKLPCLLELLTVLPEEAENFKVGVMPSRRDEFRKGLNHSGEQVLALLGQVCSQCTGQEKILNNLLKCIASWLRQGSLPSKHLSASPLLTFAFGAMTSPLFFDNAADMLIELVHYTHDYEVHGPLIAEIVPQVLQLVPQFDAALQQEDEDRARALCRLFTEMAEQYLQLLIVQQPDWAMQTAQAVLRGAFHPEPDIAEITFNFWYMLSEEIHGSGRTLTDAQRTECRARFADVFLRLLEALRGLAEYPTESAEWPADQKDDFIRFRYTVGDAISDACKVLSAKRCIESGFEALQQRLQPFAQQPAQLWRGVEACVYCLRQMNSNHDPTFFSADIVGQFMRLIPTLPAVGELQNTCIRTIGTYANYLSRNAEMLPPLLQYVSQGLTQPESAAAASQAMKHLCDACAEHLADEQTMAMLLLMYHGTLQLELKNADRVDLISALAFVISQMALPQVLPAMQAVAQPILEKLQGGLASGASGGDVSNCLDLLCGLLRDVKPNQQVNSDLPLLQDAPHPSVQASFHSPLCPLVTPHSTRPTRHTPFDTPHSTHPVRHTPFDTPPFDTRHFPHEPPPP